MKKFWQQKENRVLCFIALLFLVGVAAFSVQLVVDMFRERPFSPLRNGVFHPLYFDSFADFFNINLFIQDYAPYTVFNSSYPPFNFLLALPFMRVMKIGREDVLLRDVSIHANAVWQDWLALALFFLTVLCMSAILFRLFQKKYNVKPATLCFLILISLISSPFLFLAERGNYVFFPFFFTAVFLLCHDDKRPARRILSLISLAVAVAMKMYPAIFALLLLKKKRFRDCFIAAGLSILFFFLPFFLLEGGFTDNLLAFLKNLTAFSSYTRLSIDVSTGNALRILAYLFGKDPYSVGLSRAALFLRGGLFLLSIALLFFTERTWQRVTLLSLMIVVVPMPAMIHSLIFVLLGFALFIVERPQRTVDYWYGFLFFLILTPLQFGHIVHPVPLSEQVWRIQMEIGLTVNVALAGTAVILLAITILADTVTTCINGRRKTAA